MKKKKYSRWIIAVIWSSLRALTGDGRWRLADADIARGLLPFFSFSIAQFVAGVHPTSFFFSARKVNVSGTYQTSQSSSSALPHPLSKLVSKKQKKKKSSCQLQQKVLLHLLCRLSMRWRNGPNGPHPITLSLSRPLITKTELKSNLI